MNRLEIATALLRGVHIAALLSLLGSLVFRSLVLPSSATAGVPPLTAMTRVIGSVSGWLALVFGGAWLTTVSGAVAGGDNLASMFEAVPVVVRHTSFGSLVAARLVLLAGVLVLLSRPGPRAGPGARAGALLTTAAALALQPLLGHIGALTDGARTVLIPIEIAHLLAAGAWLGGLLPLLLCVSRASPPLAATLSNRFSPVGLVAVGTIAVTALPLAGELVGGIGGLAGTQYGHFALVKLGLFVMMLVLACANRLVLTVRLGSERHCMGRRSLIVSIAVEAVIAVCVVLTAALLASSAPAVHTQPVWPFSWRPGLGAWEEPGPRSELMHLLIAAAICVALIGISQVIRRFRVIAVGLAAIVAAPFVPAFGLLLVEAYPTSYARSPTGFSAQAIVRGQTLFGQLCAACHEARNGSGDEADLTAPHIWGHPEGDLFWRISHGVLAPAGAALMPGFEAALSDDDLWSLIDFIHARNIGLQNEKEGRWSPPVPAPGTPLICNGSDAGDLGGLRGHRVRIMTGDDPVSMPAEPREPDLTTVRLTRGAASLPASGECATAAPMAWDAWALLAGVAPEQFAGYQAIVDRQGWLRAWFPPGAGADQLRAAIDDARDHPIAAEAASASGHRH